MQRCFHLISGVSRKLTNCASIFFWFFGMSWNFRNCLMMGTKHLTRTKERSHVIKQRSPDEIRVWQTWSPIFVLEIMSATITCFASLVTINLVPLHNPWVWSKFLNSIIGVPILSLRQWLGKPDVVNELRNSVVSERKWQLSMVSDLSTESQLR